MDYEDLIYRFRETAQNGDVCRGCTFCIEAADAIETLLAERDAAVEELRGDCWCCANGKPWEKAGPFSKMTCCEHLKEHGVIAKTGKAYKCQYWQWRGLQKEGGT